MSAAAKWTAALMVACLAALVLPALAQNSDRQERRDRTDRAVCSLFADVTGTECDR